jgi:hypothetical protein
MASEDIHHMGVEGSPGRGSTGSARPRISRRQMLGRISSGAAVGAAAWVVPEILTAKPAAGATMSGAPNTNPSGGGTATSPSSASTASQPVTTPAAAAPTSSGGTGTPAALAMTGLNIKRDAEIGATLVAGGWAMQRWASRTPKVAGAEAGEVHEAGSPGDSA